MKKTDIAQIRNQEPQALQAMVLKHQIELYQEKAALAQAGKKNSKQTIILRKEIARIQTVISEKILSEVK